MQWLPKRKCWPAESVCRLAQPESRPDARAAAGRRFSPALRTAPGAAPWRPAGLSCSRALRRFRLFSSCFSHVLQTNYLSAKGFVLRRCYSHNTRLCGASCSCPAGVCVSCSHFNWLLLDMRSGVAQMQHQ